VGTKVGRGACSIRDGAHTFFAVEGPASETKGPRFWIGGSQVGGDFAGEKVRVFGEEPTVMK
jgi:hypothetical protein